MITGIVVLIIVLLILAFWLGALIKIMAGSFNVKCFFISVVCGAVSVYYFYKGGFDILNLTDPYLWLYFIPAYAISAFIGGSIILENKLKEVELTDKANEVIELENRIKELKGK